MSTPQLSVIIVTHNVAHLIGDCLRSVFEECAGMSTEVFVVDSASSDDTVEVVHHQFPRVTVRVSRENIGFSAANNLALAECSGEYIVLLNPDTVVHPGAFRRLMFYLDTHPPVGAVGPTLRLADNSIQPECARNLPSVGNMFAWLLLLDKLEWKLRYGNARDVKSSFPPNNAIFDRFLLLFWDRSSTCEVECIAGACMMFRAEVAQLVGALDETTPLYLDDIDYCRRIRDSGWAIHYVAEATVSHFWKQSTLPLKRLGDLYAMVCHSIWLYLRKHDGPVAAALFSSEIVIACLIRLPVSGLGLLLAGKKSRAFWKYQVEMILGLCRWVIRFPKVAPSFGFVNESRAQQSSAIGRIA